MNTPHTSSADLGSPVGARHAVPSQRRRLPFPVTKIAEGCMECGPLVPLCSRYRRTVITRHVAAFRLLLRAAFLLAFLLPRTLPAQQTEPIERAYNHSQVEVEEALQKLQAYATNRLPILDGFVKANAETLERFDNPHYQLRISIFAQGPTQTLVQVTAKITAWYADADPAHSQYTLIPSNGRLEQDMLDRLSIYLEKGAVQAAPSSVPPADASPGSPAGHSPEAPPNADPPSRAAASPAPPAAPTDPTNIAARIASVQSERQAVEMNQRKLQQQISELEANSRSQRYLRNMAVVHSAGTPIFEQADETSAILFRADPEDEFEVLEVRGRWVQISTENSGRAWVRAAQLQPENEVDDAEESVDSPHRWRRPGPYDPDAPRVTPTIANERNLRCSAASFSDSLLWPAYPWRSARHRGCWSHPSPQPGWR